LQILNFGDECDVGRINRELGRSMALQSVHGDLYENRIRWPNGLHPTAALTVLQSLAEHDGCR